MSSSFLQLARKSLPRAAAAATVTTAAFLATNVADNKDDKQHKIGATSSSDATMRPHSLYYRPSIRSFPVLSPAFSLSRNNNVALCEAAPQTTAKTVPAPYKPVDPTEPNTSEDPTSLTNSDGKQMKMGASMWGDGGDNDALYHGLFPRRQLWRPRLEYPLWDYNWDERQPPPIVASPPGEGGVDADGKSAEDATKVAEAQRERYIRKKGVTRHVILIRHGQYDETSKEDSQRLLTPLGRTQAELTGKRLAKLIRGVNDEFGPCRVKVIRVSDLARAKETADIIYDNLDLESFEGEVIERSEPDPLLNEGRPCHHIPGGRARSSVIERTDEHHPRIEHAFKKYFFRAEPPTLPPAEDSKTNEKNIVATSTDTGSNESDASTSKHSKDTDSVTTSQIKSNPQHEFEIIVCHANVIRYFFCRALQLPPEAWLRLCIFNCSLTYFTIRPTGTVSCRMLGDIGHLPYDSSTFSMHTGFNW